MAIEDEIKAIEEEIQKTPYNKATQKHIGKLKAKLAKLRSEQTKASKGKPGVGYGLKKRGDATVLLVGFPSVGKSTLLNQLTAAESKVGEYEFTTLDVIPGMLSYNGARIQVLDVPGLIEGGASGKGRGKAVLSVIRNADLILILVDAGKPEQAGKIKKELLSAGIRLDQRPPEIRVYKKARGGIQISAPKKLGIDKEVIASVLNEFGMYNADIVIRERVDLDQIVDALARNLVYAPTLTVVNKIDTVEKPTEIEDSVPISALEGKNLGMLKEAIWQKLGLIRVYLKRIGKEPDMREPMILKGGLTIRDLGERIHAAFVKDFKYARIWGPSAKFAGQRVGLEHRLLDNDIVEMHLD
jgi:ribosome-interacting GTPase 1